MRRIVLLLLLTELLWYALGPALVQAGYFMFSDFRKFAVMGLANCFTIVGTIIVTFAFIKEHRAKFIGCFSLIFLTLNFLVLLPIVAMLIL